MRIICTLHDQEQVEAELVGEIQMTDLSVIKLDLSDYRKPLPVAEFGDSDSVQVGQYVLAMGSPLSLSRSVSAEWFRRGIGISMPMCGCPVVSRRAIQFVDSDRCGDQSGEFGRPAGGSGRSGSGD